MALTSRATGFGTCDPYVKEGSRHPPSSDWQHRNPSRRSKCSYLRDKEGRTRNSAGQLINAQGAVIPNVINVAEMNDFDLSREWYDWVPVICWATHNTINMKDSKAINCKRAKREQRGLISEFAFEREQQVGLPLLGPDLSRSGLFHISFFFVIIFGNLTFISSRGCDKPSYQFLGSIGTKDGPLSAIQTLFGTKDGPLSAIRTLLARVAAELTGRSVSAVHAEYMIPVQLLDDIMAKRDEQYVSGEMSRVEEAGTEDTTSTSTDGTTSTSIDSTISTSTNITTSTSVDSTTSKSTNGTTSTSIDDVEKESLWKTS
ncbi:hypothetical protein DY000_02013629 [Brassica cretica]|uniref:Uncharacterized protein n=1 Tax=Brassica cretica TaxID=69181 RepID=A0ABQ7D776_BRACR|nr:hypothetical protein DY000_02013629 [Brassica cretica]